LANAHAAQVADGSHSARNPWSKTNSLPPEALDAMAKAMTTYAAPELGSPHDGADSSSRDDGGTSQSSASRSNRSSYRYSKKYDRAVGAGF
jgi:hypothetical protein